MTTGFDLLGRELEAAAERQRLQRTQYRAVGISKLGQSALVTISALLVVGVAIALFATHHRRPTRQSAGNSDSSSQVSRFRDQTGWSVAYPAAFHVERSEQELHLATVEVTISSFAPRSGVRVRHYRNGGNVQLVPPLDRAGVFPSDGVAFRVVYQSGLPTLPSRLNSPGQLRLSSLRPSHGPARLRYNRATGETYQDGGYHGAPRSISRFVRAGGKEYWIVAWIGENASNDYRDKIAHMVASLRLV